MKYVLLRSTALQMGVSWSYLLTGISGESRVVPLIEVHQATLALREISLVIHLKVQEALPLSQARSACHNPLFLCSHAFRLSLGR